MNVRTDELNKQHAEQQGATSFGQPNRPSFAIPDDDYLIDKLSQRDQERRDEKGTRFEKNARDRKPTWGAAREARNRSDDPSADYRDPGDKQVDPPEQGDRQENLDPQGKIATPPAQSDEPPAYFHSLNDRLERQQQDFARKEQEHRDYMARLLQQQQQMYAQQNQQPDTLHQEFGLSSPDAISQLENRILQKANQMQAPLMAQLAYEKFQNAYHQAAKDHEHFGKYFNINDQTQKFNQILSSRPLNQTMAINWAKEFEMAYNAVDAPRRSKAETDLSKRVAELEAQLAGKTPNKAAEKKEKTNNLHLVPKANQQGASPIQNSSNSLDDYKPGEGRKRRMGDLSKFLKRKHGLA